MYHQDDTTKRRKGQKPLKPSEIISILVAATGLVKAIAELIKALN